MHCTRCGSTPTKVVVSENNPSQQPRPYHCPCCWQTHRSDKRRGYWTLVTVAAARSCAVTVPMACHPEAAA